MRKFIWIVAGLLVVALIFLWGGGATVKLAPIAGKWIHHSHQDQDWTYEFTSDKAVRFTLDNQRKKWSITDIRPRGSIIEIDIDELLGLGAKQNSTIKVEILGEDTIFVSSGLHPGMVFEKVN
ncbi:MAG: hypothetical protein AMJ79_07480 [Phycisphaerae bacterium SM23_30]|nr:MAG: hypothetical protein AMJ79_07480 [Phycisphaerae bacterium SM23_30]